MIVKSRPINNSNLRILSPVFSNEKNRVYNKAFFASPCNALKNLILANIYLFKVYNRKIKKGET